MMIIEYYYHRRKVDNRLITSNKHTQLPRIAETVKLPNKSTGFDTYTIIEIIWFHYPNRTTVRVVLDNKIKDA